MTQPYIGQVNLIAFNFAPRGWADCTGSLLPIAENSALYALLGTTFGGDGRTTFGLPDLQGRVAVGEGSGIGLTPRTWGQRGGTETVTLSAAQMPSHNHSIFATFNSGDTNTPAAGKMLGKGSVGSGLGAQDALIYADTPATMNDIVGIDRTSNTGGTQAHPNMQPFLSMRYVIALEGLFPPRN